MKIEIRVDGLPEDSLGVEVLEDEEIENDTFIPEHEILERKVSRAIPFIDIGEPMIEIKGKHIVLRILRHTRQNQSNEASPLTTRNKSLDGR